MKICISSTGPSEDSGVNPVFGRCQYFIVYNLKDYTSVTAKYDDKKKEFAVVKNDAWQAPRGAGIVASQKIADLGCKILITGNVGPNAFYALKASGMKIYAGVFGKTVKEALKAYQEKKLNETEMPTGRGFGRGFGVGPGFGGSRGPGMGRKGRR